MKKNNRGFTSVQLVAVLITIVVALSGCTTAESCLTSSATTSGGSGISGYSMFRPLPREPEFIPATKPTGAAGSVQAVPPQAFSTSRLHLLAGGPSAKKAIVFIGGIHDSYRYFDNWIDVLAAPGKVVLGWQHDHRSMPMAQSAALFAADLFSLRNAGVAEVTIVAHSIGGLVAKGAIDRLAETNQAQKFNQLALHAMGTPWGGFAILKYASYVPGSAIISTFFGYPMAEELAPGSAYLTRLGKAMPANAELHLYTGENDQTARPVRASTKRRYAAIEVHATSTTTISDFRHNDYNKSPALAILTLMQQTRQRCGVLPCRQIMQSEGGCSSTNFTVAHMQ